ncbi:MAG: mannose-1-phosphate guanylyltransferase [Bacteroidetes bacterium]|nr:mannose-1-phosphate guanylyltransferase [Bacteroidota bacterium]
MKNNYCIIMAGGIGSRFWPISKSSKPKQFLDILNVGKTLLQLTFERIEKVCPKENIFIVANVEYKELIQEQLPNIDESRILCEPQRRNTAPCVAYASHKIAALNPEARLIIAPSDHLILKEDVFTEVLKTALNACSMDDCLVTLGIEPNRPDTGYGYIQATDESFKFESKLKKVKTFTEKPNLEMAKFFLQSGDFSWNSGIFIWSAKSIITALEKHLPEINNIFKEGKNAYNTPQEEAFIIKAYSECTNISIDYGIMEKAKNMYVLPCEFGWTDLGTWGSVYEHLDKDDKGNAVIGKNVKVYNSENNIFNVSNGKLVVVSGLNDFIIVDSDNVLLICPKGDEQQIKQFVNDVSSDAKLKKYL